MRASASRSEPWRSADLIAPAAILLAAVIAYHGSFSVPFFFDDVAAIAHNPSIKNLWRLDQVLSPPADGGGMTGRPVVNLSLAFNYAISGTDVRGYHLFNLIVHAISALALFGVVRRTLLQPVLRDRFGSVAPSLAFLITVLWTVHPLQTESVTCVIQRTELLVSGFYLLTLYGFIRASEAPSSWAWPALTITCCALGMASKEVMVSAPLILLLYDRTFAAGTFREAWHRRRWLHLGVAATWLILIALLVSIGGARGTAAGFGLGISAWSYALKQCEAIVTYLALSIWPHPLVIDYGTDVITDPARVAGQAFIIVALVALTLAALRWRPALGFVLTFCFVILAPSSSVVPLITQTMAEHRMYLPLAALVSLAVIVLYRVAGIRVAKIAVIAAAALAVGTHARNRTLQDEVALWTDAVAKRPTNPRAHASLGLALSDRGRVRDALPCYRKALELDPTSVATEQNIGNAYYRLGDFGAAVAHFRRAVTLDPKFASGYNNLGAALWELHDADAALEAYRAALRLDPNHVGAHQNAGRALFALGRFPEAVTHYEHAVRLSPNSAGAHYDLGLALSRVGESDRAAEHFAAALRLRPSAGSYLNYARFLAQSGHPTDAIDALESALRLQPNFPDAQRELDQLRSRSIPAAER
jgi:tetratricopeptide (TPR) repeat protein